jgi:hypothetical protein
MLINSLRVLFVLHLRGQIGGWIGGRRFVLQRSEGFTGYRIHLLPFDTYRFTNRGSRDDSHAFIDNGLRRPTPIWPIRSKSRLRAVCCTVLTKLQSLFRLAKIEL